MNPEQQAAPSPEERVEIEKQRTLSDAELLKGGAEYKMDEDGHLRLEVTPEQIEAVKREMDTGQEGAKEKRHEMTKEEIKQILIERISDERNAKYDELTNLVPKSIREGTGFQGREPKFSIQAPGWYRDFVRQTVPERLGDFERILKEASKKHSRLVDVLHEQVPIEDVLKDYPDLAARYGN